MSGEDFGTYLKQLRKEKGYESQRRFAVAAGISNGTIARIELDKQSPDPDTLRKFSNVLDIQFIELMIKAGHVTEDEVLTFRSKNGISP
ncbi:helix-turn-helix domain-containing protein [Bacillus sp. FJAT-26390]|uniref:helix-turn-helix domain-containing protein n=1 Tax=Bacillus sp. FJAT-26390 TaxID=1743142 RepID=UPI000807C542|nr:helix-turn-helix transcriptional regulator [Bacillus sp. FJAT-26390]OBZ08024.1 hypothetical protein A7975_27225 [Bacillus sp. FJAT-26390]